MPALYTPRVILKFENDLIDIKDSNAIERFLDRLLEGKVPGAEWHKLIAQPRFKGITLQKLLTVLDQTALLDLIDLARKDPSYDDHASTLLTYFFILCPPTVEPEDLVMTLSSWKALETVYIGEGPAEEPGVNPGRNPATGQKDTGYLLPAPAGIDAYYAWNQPGGDGGRKDGVRLRLFDIESNWDTTHPELTRARARWTSWGDRTVRAPNHGTKVLGVIIASDSNPSAPYDQSSLGITPNVAATLLASYWKNGSTVDHFNTILFAILQLKFGDVLLLETQISILGTNGQPITDRNGNLLVNLPVEYVRHNFDVIRLGAALGRVIIEPAGNNKYDLGTLGKPWLTRPSTQDSVAIMVSAASPWNHGGSPTTPPDYIHLPMPIGGGKRLHNFGDRVDCYTWGDNIYTTDVGGYGNFGDTSGASAIIAGVALSIQGMAVKKHLGRYAPRQLRAILSDAETGTLAGSSAPPPNQPIPPDWNQYKIGVMPDLKTICKMRLGL